jgi:hypothetical protein
MPALPPWKVRFHRFIPLGAQLKLRPPLELQAALLFRILIEGTGFPDGICSRRNISGNAAVTGHEARQGHASGTRRAVLPFKCHTKESK